METNFKIYWKEYLIGILLIAVLIIAYTANLYYQRSLDNDKLVKASKVLNNPAAPITERYIDSAGKNHVQIKTADNDVPEGALDHQLQSTKGIIDTAMQALNLKNASQIQELTAENLQLKERIRLVPSNDSSQHGAKVHDDKWLHLVYYPLNDSLQLNYNATLTSVVFARKSWVPFVRPAYFTDFYGDDPRMTIGGVKHIRVIQKEPLIGFTADVKTSYFPYSGRLIPSLGATMRLGDFYIGARGYYSAQADAFRPIIDLSYRIINH